MTARSRRRPHLGAAVRAVCGTIAERGVAPLSTRLGDLVAACGSELLRDADWVSTSRALDRADRPLTRSVLTASPVPAAPAITPALVPTDDGASRVGPRLVGRGGERRWRRHRWVATRLRRLGDWLIARPLPPWVLPGAGGLAGDAVRLTRLLSTFTDESRTAPVVTVRERSRRGPAGIADHHEEPSFPIDVVYTWVDDRDAVWRARCARAIRSLDADGLSGDAANPCRFRNRDELRYSLRSLAVHAPFVRNVFIVTAGQVPPWLDQDLPNVRVVPHEEILDPECLPTFNSHAIETALHRIHGLAEHYLYLNDDFFFGRACRPSTFFTSDGRTKLFPDHRATVPLSPASPSDRPVDSASKNTRELIWSEFGLRVAHKVQHAPYPQRRSVLSEMEERFPWVFKRTARNPFRHHTDVNIPSCFSHYYALATGAAVAGEVPAGYINIGSPWAPLQMRRLLQRGNRDVFCLNEGAVSLKRQAIVDTTVEAFLTAYFPFPSPFERSATHPPEAGHVREAVDRG